MRTSGCTSWLFAILWLANSGMLAFGQAAKDQFDPAAFGAKADGATDDTAAIQKALDAAGKQGGVVKLAASKYLVAGSLKIPQGVALVGSNKAPLYIEPLVGTVILATGGRDKEDATARFEMGNSATVQGITLFYPPSPVIKGLIIDPGRQSAGNGDNWPITWADDDAQYTVYCDGKGFGGGSGDGSMSLARITGSPPNIQGENIVSPYLLCTATSGSRQWCGTDIKYLGIFDSPTPWGPWTAITQIDGWGGEENRFQPRIPSKWISEDGKTFCLLYSCFPKGPYQFNVQKCVIHVAGDEQAAKAAQVISAHANYPKDVPDYADAAAKNGAIVVKAGESMENRKARNVQLIDKPPAAPSMKGWELYIWRKDGDTYFALLPGTNRLKFDDEISKAAVKGIDAIKPKLDELKPGQDVFVVGKKLMEPPSKDQAAPVVEYGKKIGLKVQGQSQ